MRTITCDICGKRINTFITNSINLSYRYDFGNDEDHMQKVSDETSFDDVCDECLIKIHKAILKIKTGDKK